MAFLPELVLLTGASVLFLVTLGEGRVRQARTVALLSSFATINTSGLLGEQYIGFEVGGDTEILKSGDVIKKTQSAVVLEKLISQFMFSKAADDGGKK